MPEARLVLFLLLASVVGCKGKEKGPTAPPGPARTLTVVVGRGVVGTPSDESRTYPNGASVPYTFVAKAGFENLRVLIDDDLSSPSGTVQLDMDRRLTAVADTTIEVPVLVRTEVNATTTAFAGLRSTSTKPMDAYRSVINAVTALAGRVAAESLSHYVRRARIAAYGPQDAAAVARSLMEINDSLRVTGGSSTRVGRAATRSVDDSPSEFIVVYVNGINTDGDGAAATSLLLEKLIETAFPGESGAFRVESYHNPTGNGDDQRALATYICLQSEADRIQEGKTPLPDGTCETLAQLVPNVGDYSEALIQVLSRLLYPSRSALTPTAAGLSARLAALAARSRVIVVSHSQGNLFTHEAFRALESGETNGRCIGTVSLAPPVPVTPMGPSGSPSASFVAGTEIKDALLQVDALSPGLLIGINTVPTNTNGLSDALDHAYRTLSNIWLNILTLGGTGGRAATLKVRGGIALHEVNGDYLGANKAVTSEALRTQATRLRANCVHSMAFQTQPASAVAGSTIPAVEVRLLGPLGNVTTTATTPVTLSLVGGPASARLSGTLTAIPVNGIARFNDLSIDQAGTYTLAVTTPGVPQRSSATFSIAPVAAQGGLTGKVLAVSSSGLTTVPLAGAAVRVLSGSTPVFNGVTAADGSYLTGLLSVGSYTVEASATGFITASLAGATVSSGITRTLANIPLVPSSSTAGSISGSVLNAQTNGAISGATVELRARINATSGGAIASTTSSAGGTYTFTSVPAGTYTVTARRTGFVENLRTGISVGGGQNVSGQNVILSTTAASGTLRIVLTWGSTPSDLDAHLTGPSGSGRFHVYFSGRGSLSSAPFAELDIDDVSSFGPETITISQVSSGVYRFSIHDYSNRNVSSSSALANSGAQVNVYEGSTLRGQFFVPNAAGTLWTVFEMQNGLITPINSMTYQPLADGVALRAPGPCWGTLSDTACFAADLMGKSKPPTD